MADWIWQRPEWPDLTYDAAALQSDFMGVAAKAGYLAGVRSGLSLEDRRNTLLDEVSTEIVNSFAIEGETLNPRMVRDSLHASLTARDADIAAENKRESTNAYRNVADVMLDARDTDQPMTIERLNGWHETLFARDKYLDDVGRLRTDRNGPMQVVSQDRNGVVTEIHFEAPGAETLQSEMTQLVKWIAQTGPDGPAGGQMGTPGRAAIAHLWFETLHPYSDGNGRIGRALVDYIAAQDPIYAEAPFSLSRAIQADKSVYYDALSAAQSEVSVTKAGQLDATQFVGRFTGLIDQALDQSAAMAIHLNQRNRFFDAYGNQLSANQRQALVAIFESGPERLAEGISPRWYNRTADVSRQTASRDLADLTAKGILTGPHGSGPATRYYVDDVGQGISLASQHADIEKLATLVSTITDPARKARAEDLIEQMSDEVDEAKSDGFERDV